MTFDVVMEARGTHGDVMPLVTLAVELQRRGRRCHLIVDRQFAGSVSARGLSVAAVTSHLNPHEGPQGLHRVLFPWLPAIAEHFHANMARLQGAVIMTSDRFHASNLIAEKHGMRVVRTHLSPFKLRSYEPDGTPPYAHFARHPKVVAHVNRQRGALELAEVDTAAYPEPYVARHIAAFPSWFGPVRPGWPEPMTFVGFPLPQEPDELPLALTRFVENEGPPIVFTPGTGSCDVQTFSRAALECCRELSRPGLLLSLCEPPDEMEVGAFLRLPYVPLSAVLRRARSVVHHGGIGTLARALQAAVPQIISPFEFDQPQNGARVTALCAGNTLPRSELTGRSLAVLIERQGENASLRVRLAEISERIDGAAAVERWADAVNAEL